MKTCPMCGEYKSHAEFRPYSRECKPCSERKTCTKCGRSLRLSEFREDTRSWAKLAHPEGKLRAQCKECEKRGRPKNRLPVPPKSGSLPGGLYSLRELRYRPMEHIIEDLPVRDLALALGVSRDAAMGMKRDPSFYVDTELEWDEAKVAKVRKWLERQIA